MKRGEIELEQVEVQGKNSWRTIIKNRHSRLIYLQFNIADEICTVTKYFYADRNQSKTGGQKYQTVPLKFKSLQFNIKELLKIAETELNGKFYGLKFIDSDTAELSVDEYVKLKTTHKCIHGKKYRFLIMVGESSVIQAGSDNFPAVLKTRLENKIHRKIYIELNYYKDNTGVVKDCFYYDRKYKRDNIKIMPSQLHNCFFKYDRENILMLFNNELDCDFTNMIIVTDREIDIENNLTPVCGFI